MKQLLIASNNTGKILEITSILKDSQGFHQREFPHLLTPADLGLNLDIPEDGSTYLENAAIKARAFCEACRIPCLADDTGLEVEALSGEPGLHSARYSNKPGATDADRRAFLLEKLSGIPRPWLARFTCTVAIATPSGDLFFTDGDCSGEIIPDERGDQGFGYDAIFYLPGMARTMAELSLKEKNHISHRAAAVLKAVPFIATLE